MATASPAPGSVDDTFNAQIERIDPSGLRSSGTVRSMIVLLNHAILVGGDFTRVNDQPVNHLARLHPDGTLDPNFAAEIDPAGAIHAIVPASDGRLWIGGSFKRVGGQRRVGLARLLADGSLDPSFELIPELTGDVQALVREPGNAPESLIVGGHFQCLDPLRARWIRHLGRLTLGGGWDATFHFNIGQAPAPFSDTTEVTSLALQKGNRLRVTLRPPLAPPGNTALWALDPTGDWDPDFAQYFRTSQPDLIVIPLKDDRLLVSHGWGGGGMTPVIRLLQSNGDIDPASPPWTAQLYAATTQPDGQIVFAARFDLDPVHADITLFRWRPDATLDPAFGRTTRFDRPPTQLAFQSDGKLLVAGAFETLDGTRHRAIGRCHGGTATAPQIVESPRPRSVVAGEEVALTVVAEGSNPLAYQWRNAGRELYGETNATLILPSVRGNEVHIYDVLVTNLVGATTSAVARLSVLTPTAIVSPPENGVYQPGATVIFNVVATGASPLTYQWIHDGRSIPQATQPTLEVGPITPDHLGSYWVIVSGPGGTLTSPPAFLKLRGAQPGDIDPSFAPGTGVAGNVYAIRSLADGRVAVGGSFTQIAGLYRENMAVLLTNGTPDPGFVARLPSTLRVVSIDVQRDGRFVVGGRIDGPLGSEGYIGVLGVDGHAIAETRKPTLINCVLVQPDDKIVVAGAFRWVASPTHVYTNLLRLLPDLSWDPSFTTNGSPNSYVSCVRQDSAGRLLVAGSFTGILGYRRLALARLFPDGWVDPSFDAGTILDPSGVATVYDLAPAPDQQAWYACGRFESINGQPIRGVTRLSSNGRPDSSFAFSMAGTLHELARVVTVQSNGCVLVGGAFDSHQTGGISAYVLRLTPDGRIDRTFGAQTGLSADVFALAVQPDQKLLIGGSLMAQNPEPQRGILRTLVGDPTSPFFVTLPQGAVLPPGADMLLFGQAAGARMLAYHWERNGHPLPGATEPPLILRGLAESDSGDYVLWVSNAFGIQASPPARVDIVQPPSITTAPTSQTVVAGANVSLSIAAVGGSPLTYQWMRDSVQIRQATNNSLILPSVTTNDAGNYLAVVSNRLTKVSSLPARLTVVEPPRILSLPHDQRVFSGRAADFTVTAAGTRPLDFQWLKDDHTLSGATSNRLSIPVTRPADAGLYRVVITNTHGAITSAPVSLEILVPPVITQAPTGMVVPPGGDAVLNVEASGSPPLFYQWTFNDLEIPGANSPMLRLLHANASMIGDYAVIVGSPAGMTASVPVRFALLDSLPALTELQLAFGPDGAFFLHATAQPGTYRIEAADDLLTWSTLWIGSPTEGRLTFIDSESPFAPHRFYRIQFTPDGFQAAASSPSPTAGSDVVTPSLFNPRDHDGTGSMPTRAP
ncbi:MAG: immunoglobulin domain-containing protein [Verrucomicrobiales bacterium]|nr:immunoglobulin domain-containing protein [Verrucomicrobiales bacterium]